MAPTIEVLLAEHLIRELGTLMSTLAMPLTIVGLVALASAAAVVIFPRRRRVQRRRVPVPA